MVMAVTGGEGRNAGRSAYRQGVRKTEEGRMKAWYPVLASRTRMNSVKEAVDRVEERKATILTVATRGARARQQRLYSRAARSLWQLDVRAQAEGVTLAVQVSFTAT